MKKHIFTFLVLLLSLSFFAQETDAFFFTRHSRFKIYKQISLGGTHTCGITTSDKLFCWGGNDYGQIGDGTITNREKPVAIDPTNTYSQVSAGPNHTCAIRADDKLFCWGYNYAGQLGNGNTNYPQKTPVIVAAVAGSSDTYSQVSAGGEYNTCAIGKIDKKIYCWGSNSDSQLGRTGGMQTSPTSIDSANTYLQVSVGYRHACGITIADDLQCWGKNDRGQATGNLNTANQASPFTIKLYPSTNIDDWSQVSAGKDYTCAIKKIDGKLYCWGDGSYGKLGNNSTSSYGAPVYIDSNYTYSQIATSVGVGEYTCGITTTGALRCWGRNSYGQLGRGFANNYDGETSPGTTTNSTIQYKRVFLGENSTCAETISGVFKCFGYNSYSQIGNIENIKSVKPIFVGISNQKLIFTSHTAGSICSIGNDDKVKCWGNNMYRQLGDNTRNNRSLPIFFGNSSYLYSKVSVGPSAICGMSGSGAYCAGYNGSSNKLRATGTDYLSVPTYIAGNISQFVVGDDYSCYVGISGTLVCRGSNYYGQIANGSNTGIASDITVITSQISQVSAGLYHVCAIASGAYLYCWGWNYLGQVGNGSAFGSQADKVTSIAYITNSILQVSAGSYHTCAIKYDGKLYCWGNNASGQVGDNTSISRNTLTLIDSTNTYSQVSAGSHHTCGIRSSPASNGKLYCWGSNSSGQLGDGTFVNRSTPTPIDDANTYSQVSAGSSHTCAITTAGDVYCWGSNMSAEFGNGRTYMIRNLRF